MSATRALCPTCGSEPYAGHVLWCGELVGRTAHGAATPGRLLRACRCRIVEGLILLFDDHAEAVSYAALCQEHGREGCTYDVVPATSRSAARSSS